MIAAAARTLAAVALLLPGSAWPLFSGSTPGIDVRLDGPSIAEAVRIGTSRDAVMRERFHAAYRQPLRGELSGHVEIVTEFRRAVLLTEERVRMADIRWDARAAAAELRRYRGLVSVILRLQFHPQNTYQSVPAFDTAFLRRAEAGGLVQPLDTQSSPRYVASQPAPPGTPILSAEIESIFPADRLDLQQPYLLAVRLQGREVERLPVDLSRIR